jgi:3-methyladenine DNA glycosylase/8-oxoguanine DNA glycosylase
MPSTLRLHVPSGFRLRSVVFSHGWYDLSPFHWNEEAMRLSTAAMLSGSPVDLVFSQPSKERIEIHSPTTIPKSKHSNLERLVAEMLSLPLNLDDFYSSAGKRFHWARELGVGRFMRGASAFEDTVKMLATTNCSWSLTKLMTTRMVERLGAKTPEGNRAFPTPKALAEQDLGFYRDELRAGYRAEYFQRLSRRVASRELDVESWPKFSGDAVELGKLIRVEKGCGPYVVENLCRLFGRFDGLGIDSFCRRKFVEVHGEPTEKVDDAIRAKYKRFGRWQGLALWLDLTKDWHVDGEGRKGKLTV